MKKSKTLPDMDRARMLRLIRAEVLAALTPAPEATPSSPPARTIVRRRMTRLDALAEMATRVGFTLDMRVLPKHVREIRFLEGDTERFVAIGIRQAETWLAGFLSAKAA